MIERIPIDNKAQWLSLRKYDVTASSIGALWSLHPYVSPLRLYIEKQGIIDLPPVEETSVMRRGRILESAVAAAVAEQKPEWTIEKASEYFRDPDLGLACTPDFFIYGDPRGHGILQAKTAAPSVYQRDWKEGQPPFWITLQATVEMMLTEATFAAVAVLVVDPFNLPCHIVEIPRHEATEKKIREGVARFWKDVEEGNEPGADYGLDRELLKALSPTEQPDKKIDLSADNEIVSGLKERADLRAQIKKDDDRCKEIEAMVMARMKDAAVADVPDFYVSWKKQTRKGYIVQPSEPRVLLIREKREQA